MIIAVASGKGGTGKTTVAASLAVTWPVSPVAVDLDVDEPNLHLFLRPEPLAVETVTLEVPAVDLERCTRCRACAELCQFKAIAVLGKTVVTFPEMCHGCGGCMAVCPERAIGTAVRELGVMERGLARGSVACLTGRLRIGEAMSPPLMRHVRSRMRDLAAQEGADILIDAPPGVSCPAMNAVADSDVILLVTEPTPFGFHDFGLAVEAFAPLGKPMAVVVNRAGLGDGRVYGFCEERGLPVVAEIPYRRDIAEHYSRGLVLAEMDGQMGELFSGLCHALAQLAKEARHA